MPVDSRIYRLFSAAAILCLLAPCSTQAATLRFDADTLYQRAITSNIALSPDGSALQLRSGEVIQDDGPAAGFSYKPNREILSPEIEIRKELMIRDPRASEAELLVGGRGRLNVEVNNEPQKLGDPRTIYRGQWYAYPLNPGALRPGLNNIVIRGSGWVEIARADDSYVALPHRSARSTDNGKTWNIDKLGQQGNIAGEYCVRLYLEQFVSRGTVLLPVMDVANLNGNTLPPPVKAPGPLRISVQASSTPGADDVGLRMRSGTTYVPNLETWSDWAPLGDGAASPALHGRFFQIEITLTTTDPKITPRLSGISIVTNPNLARDWTKTIKVADVHNEEIVRTSIPFRYEPFTQPQLKELRQRYHLDQVVDGAKTDLDILTRLAGWSSQQWKWEEWHLDDFYPDWNALEILKILPDGKHVGGFCQQYNLIFLQAAESFGFVGRDVSIDSGTMGRPTTIGHEAIEIWSNQFRKWIWVDGMMAYYAEDAATGVPLSLWELRQRQLQLMQGGQPRPIRVVRILDTKMPSDPDWLWQAANWHGLDAGMSFTELRLIPRSNFLEQKWPLPLNNGKAAWSWTGFEVWTDTKARARLLYPNLITQQGDFEWTLNQAHFYLEPTPTANVFRVHLDTVTPGFAMFMARIDGKPEAPVAAVFTWKLHSGRNRLKVWPRNDAGRDGIASWIKLDAPRPSSPSD